MKFNTMMTPEQIKELCDSDSVALLGLLAANPKADTPSYDDEPETQERATKAIAITDEFWTGAVQYRVTWPEGLQGRKQYSRVMADVKKNPDEISPEFKGLIQCLIASGVVTKGVALLFHSPEPQTAKAIVGTIVTIGVACFLANPVTPAEFTDNIIKASFSSRWGSWG
jgi:hypothetical protein